MNWGAFNSSSPNIDVASIAFPIVLLAGPIQAGTDPYEIISATVASASDPSKTTVEYYETSYTTGNNNQITITNNTGDTEVISNVGYFLSDTLIPLDQLNAASLSSDTFTSDPALDGTYLPNSSSPTPEPTSIAMFGAAAAGLFLLRRPKKA